MFCNCRSLTGLTLPGSVTVIDAYSFANCDALETLTIPVGVKEIGNFAFRFSGLKSIVLPDSVTTVGNGIFNYCESLKSAVLSSKMAAVPEGIFYNCKSLASVTIPEGITDIGDSAFENCKALPAVTLPKGTVRVGVSAFSGCSGLKKVTLPVSVKKIEYEAFCWVGSLTDVYYGGTREDRAKITFGDHNSQFLDATWHYQAAPDKTDLSGATFSKIKDQVYTGKAIKPAFTVKLKNKKLTEGTDYTVSWKSNKSVGTATVTITGKGSYKGTAKATFTINPKAAALSSLKAGKQQLTVKWKKGSGIDGYEIQYSLKKDFSKPQKATVKGEKTTKTVIKKMKKGTWYVRIRAYKKSGGKTYYSAWSKTLSKKVK